MIKFKMDMHMHFDLYKDKIEVLKYIEKSKSYTIAVTNLPDLYEKYLHFNDGRKYVKCALGFHPELVQQYAHQLVKFDRYLATTRYVGEIGLDYTIKDASNIAVQNCIFSHIVYSCNQQKNKILTVHSRRAEKQVVEVLNDLSSSNKVIMHWYSGSISVMDEALERGYFFSVNHQMLNSANGRRIIEHIPIERILLESDAPFTRGMNKTYSISFMDPIYGYLCEHKKMSDTELSGILKQNLKSLLTNNV